MATADDRAADSKVHSELVRAFRHRPPSDALLVLFGNGALLVLTVILFQDDAPGARIWWWAGLILVTILARTSWRRWAARRDMSDTAFLTGMRAVVAVQGSAWGIGAALLMPWMQPQELAIFVAGLAGIMGSALNTLAADSRSFRWFALGVTAPLTLGMLLQFTDQQHLVLAALTVAFTATMLFIHRRVNGGLLEHLRIVDRLSTSEQDQARLIAELRTALGAVKQLTGLLPICANCKKVRNDSGYWSSVEQYVTEHTDAQFSHGVCPDCLPKLFPGIPLPETEHV